MDATARFPDYIEPFAQDYLRQQLSIESPFEEGSCLSELEQKCICEPTLQSVWERATKYYPDFPARGQLALLSSIWHSVRYEGIVYATEREAEEWRLEFLRKAQDLRRLWKKKPANYMTLLTTAESFRRLEQDRYFEDLAAEGAKHLEAETADERIDYFRVPMMIESGDMLSIYIGSAKKAKYNSRGHGKHVRGPKAQRAYFVRNLSARLRGMTGEWKRDSVARITSLVFECNITAEDVRRMCSDLTEAIYDEMDNLSDDHWRAFIMGEGTGPLAPL